MKTFLSLIFGLTFIVNSCHNTDDSDRSELSVLTTLKSENGISYTESLNKWNALKKDNGNSYSYQTTFQSWVGFGHTTELIIKEGRVVARVYEEFQIDGQTGARVITDSYTENENNLGNNEKGAAPLSIDDLYTSCASDYLVVDKEKNTLYFETNESGMLSRCGFVPNGCADDCFQGLSIHSFRWVD